MGLGPAPAFAGVTVALGKCELGELRVGERSDVLHSWCVQADWNAPTVVGGRGARLLLEDEETALASEHRRSVGYIQQAAQTLNEMVNDLLDLAKIEAGKVDVRVAPVRVAELFGTLRGMFRPLLRGDAVTLEIDDPPLDLELTTDEAKLAQILRNLVSNAIKFTQRGTVRVTAARDGDTVLFMVTDTGVGIAPEHLERIFHEFEQIPGPLQQRAKGTGLGLPLSRRLAGLLGGSLSVASTVGSGSTFTVRLPAVGTSHG